MTGTRVRVPLEGDYGPRIIHFAKEYKNGYVVIDGTAKFYACRFVDCALEAVPGVEVHKMFRNCQLVNTVFVTIPPKQEEL